MPLLINEKPMGSAPKTGEEFVKKYSSFRESSLMRSQELQLVGPDGLLYIHQREMAATSPSDDKIKILGTDDATTCLMVILRHTGSCATAMAHFDDYGTEKAVAQMIDMVKDLTGGTQWGRLELHLVGGFKDEKGRCEDLSLKILGAFNSTSEEVHLITACITDFNNTTRENIPWPKIYGIAINVKTGEIFRASIADRGPDMNLRLARCLFPSEDLCTAPEQALPHFERDIRAALILVRDHPDPMKSIFTGGKPLMYAKQPDGSWQVLESESER